MDKVPLYDELGPTYDAMIAWPQRLERESPFFRSLFRLIGAGRALDVGCGTGGHVLHFAELGLEAVGADPSEELLRFAREKAAGRPGVRFVQAGLGELRAKVGGPFDVVTCLGNTLPHVLSRTALHQALQDVAGVLRPGGRFVAQLLNYERICGRRQRFLGVSAGEEGGQEVLFFRFYDFGQELLTFNLVTFRRQAHGWDFRVHSTPLRPILQQELAELLPLSGFQSVQWFGDFTGGPFSIADSNDLIAVATRGT